MVPYSTLPRFANDQPVALPPSCQVDCEQSLISERHEEPVKYQIPECASAFSRSFLSHQIGANKQSLILRSAPVFPRSFVSHQIGANRQSVILTCARVFPHSFIPHQIGANRQSLILTCARVFLRSFVSRLEISDQYTVFSSVRVFNHTVSFILLLIRVPTEYFSKATIN